MGRAWLTDPSGLLGVLFSMVRSGEDAAGIVAHFLRDNVVQFRDVQPPRVLSADELSTLISLELEARAGADIPERYAWCGAIGPSATTFGQEILEAARTTQPDPAWRERMQSVGITLERYQDTGGVSLEPFFSVDIGRDFS